MTDETGTTNPLYHALGLAQSEMTSVKFNKVNPHFRSGYADLSAIREATLPILNKHGLTITHTIGYDEGSGWFVRAWLLHPASGDTLISDFPLGNTADKPQQAGSAITYGRRYTWGALCGIVTEEDDDGNAAQEAVKAKPQSSTSMRVSHAEPANDNRPVAFDYVSWGKALVLAAGACKDADELDRLQEINEEALDKAKLEAPKIHERIQKRLDEAYNKLPAPTMNIIAPTNEITAFLHDLDTMLELATSRAAIDKIWAANKAATDAMKSEDFDRAARVYEHHVDRIRGPVDKAA